METTPFLGGKDWPGRKRPVGGRHVREVLEYGEGKGEESGEVAEQPEWRGTWMTSSTSVEVSR